MPLVHIAGKLVLFAHVPRSGGSAIENYLARRFGPLAFLDRRYFKAPKFERWSNTSPQHLEDSAFYRIIPSGWIAHSFAMVRHPEDRITSVFRYQRDLEQSIPGETTFDAWIAELGDRRKVEPHYLDNHPRPATDLVPANATVFRLEDGMDAVVTWLDDIEGTARQPRKVTADNAYDARLEKAGREPGPPPEVTTEARARIHDLFAADFERFGYEPRVAKTGSGDASDDTSKQEGQI